MHGRLKKDKKRNKPKRDPDHVSLDGRCDLKFQIFFLVQGVIPRGDDNFSQIIL
jgi:hypothetical protein